MIISVWRLSHLVLALSSFLLLTLASVTGIALAFDPVTQKMQSYKVADPDKVQLGQTIAVLRKEYSDIQKLSVDDNGFVLLEWTNEDGVNQQSYINPETGAVLGPILKQSPFFQWVTSLHRSLFLHETGRLIMGITALLLILIAASGIALIVQRQKSLRRFFSRIQRDHFAQYYHVVFGRIVLFPILVIALSGLVISMSRLEFIHTTIPTLQVDLDELKTMPVVESSQYPALKDVALSDLEALEFPFSEDVEDFYTVRLHDREMAINQITGEVVQQQAIPAGAQLQALAMKLHTGRIGIVWAIILAISSAYILFFIYSGFVIMWKRRANRSTNQHKPAESRIIILVGSEGGTTMRFAKIVQAQLLALGEKVYLTDLDNYRLFPVMEQLIVMTSTYGLGDPPSNARKFHKKLQAIVQPQSFRFSVVAFGSRSYQHFCEFGLKVDQWLREQPHAYPATDPVTVNDRSSQDFNNWCADWSASNGFAVSLSEELFAINHDKLDSFIVEAKDGLSASDTFLIRLGSPKKVQMKSGDLIAIYPKNDHRERLYSAGMVNGRIQLSVRLHAEGLGSNYLYQLAPGDSVKARIISNKNFHFPSKARSVIMISNGTGIAPFLGMIDENRKRIPVHFYCGFRFQSSYHPYDDFLSVSKSRRQVSDVHVALSREGNMQYVTELLRRDQNILMELIKKGAVLMICGSLAMQDDVLKLIEELFGENGQSEVGALRSNGRLRTDCY